ncbi:hypothetical protein SDC9_172702 [bioreactor metagenome]|uniref:4Fe4S-binding SPASM domain-containing protein n=1 Tax=bioreactor metagenome TaxID=1076179 RepID=A0A645GF26_9ZZZZ
MRGNGTFEAIERNVTLLASRCGSLVFMTTVADANVATVAELPQRLSRFKPDSWIMGQLMYLSSEDIAEYDRIALQLGQVPYPELAVWRRDDDGEYLTRLKKAEAKITASQHPFPTKFTPHNYPDSRFSDHYCQAINHRLHIRHDGECGCCTDYFGIRLGNVKQKSLSEIFYGEPTQKLREYLSDHRLPTCNHCPWLPQRSYFSKIRI